MFKKRCSICHRFAYIKGTMRNFKKLSAGYTSADKPQEFYGQKSFQNRISPSRGREMGLCDGGAGEIDAVFEYDTSFPPDRYLAEKMGATVKCELCQNEGINEGDFISPLSFFLHDPTVTPRVPALVFRPQSQSFSKHGATACRATWFDTCRGWSLVVEIGSSKELTLGDFKDRLLDWFGEQVGIVLGIFCVEETKAIRILALDRTTQNAPLEEDANGFLFLPVSSLFFGAEIPPNLLRGPVRINANIVREKVARLMFT